MKKKKVKKDIDTMIKNNDVIVELMTDYVQRYDFTDYDREQVQSLQQHLANVNLLFKQMKDI